MKHKNGKLTDIVDLNFLQEFQDNFAKSMNMACFIIDDNGHVTNPANYKDFCKKYSNCHQNCNENCSECYIIHGKSAAKKKEPVIYNCNSGLTYFAVPIMLHDLAIGYIIGGQILSEIPNEEHSRQIARELNCDENEYIEDLKDIDIVPLEKIKSAADFLFISTNSISEIANKNHILSKKQEQDNILSEIIDFVRNTTNIEKIKQHLIETVAQYFDTDRCFFVDYDKNLNALLPVKNEVRKSEEIKSFIGKDAEKEFPEFCDRVKNKRKNIIIRDVERAIKKEVFSSNGSFNKLIKNDTKSDYALILQSNNQIVGLLVLHFIENKKILTKEEFNFLKTIQYQVGQVIYRNMLIEQNQLIAKNEQSLRQILLSSANTFDFKQIINSFVTEIGKKLKADRSFFVEYDPVEDTSLPIKDYAEYRSSDSIKSHLLRKHGKEDVQVFIKVTKEKKIIFVEDINKIDLPEPSRKMLIDDLGVKAYAIFPVHYGNVLQGSLVLHYVEDYPHLSKDEMDMIQLIADQYAIIMNQAKLYAKVQQQSEKEFLLRKITQDIRSSLNVEDILTYVCKGLADIFNIQRVTIIQYPNPEDYSEFKTVKEYKLDSKIIGSSNFSVRPADANFYYEFGKSWATFLEKSKNYLVINNISESQLPDFLKESYESFGQKALMFGTISKGSQKWGVMMLSEYNTTRSWTDEDLNLLELIADQLYLAIKQSEMYSQIQLQAEREKSILSNLPFMVWLKDKDGRFLAVNELFAKACNTSIDNLIGKTDYDIWPKEIADNYVKDDMEIMKNGETRAVEEFIQSPEGPRWHETHKTPLFNEKREVIGTTGFSRDITERKEIDKMKNEFVSMVSHELRTPLTSIRGSLGLVTSGKIQTLSEKTQGLLEIANSNCIRLINLINDILDIEKIEAGKMDFEIKTLELISLIEHSIQANLQYAEKHNIGIKLSKETEKIFVKADSERLIQVVTNLLSNAIKFSQQDNSVEVSINKMENMVRVSITNFGNEISEEFKTRIFQKFAQADSSDARQKGGTGLGLNISRAIIEKLKGNIDFISQNNKTTFYFDLPELKEEKPIIRVRSDDSKPNILVCEDDKDIASLLGLLLEQENYCVDITYNAEQAEKLLQERNYDALLLDLILPDKDGLSLIQELREIEKTKNLPIIVVSVKAQEGEKELNGNFAVFDWLGKPIQKDRLFDAINRALIEKSNEKLKILHVEDDEDVRKITQIILEKDAEIIQASTLEEAKLILNSANDINVLLLDLELPDGNGSELLPLLNQNSDKKIVTIILSAHKVNEDLSKKVDAVLLKSNHSNEDLIKIVDIIKKRKKSKVDEEICFNM